MANLLRLVFALFFIVPLPYFKGFYKGSPVSVELLELVQSIIQTV